MGTYTETNVPKSLRICWSEDPGGEPGRQVPEGGGQQGSLLRVLASGPVP